jgi:hypothetical protein
MPGELQDKLKLRETLNKILKNNGVVDIEAFVGVVNELKTKLNTLINDVLGVEHSIDNIHNYDNTNIKEELKEISDQINNIHTDINNITAKSNITRIITKLSLKNPTQIEINFIVNENGDGSQAVISLLYVLMVNKSTDSNIHNALNIGGRSTETGCSLVSSNNVSISNHNVLQKVEVTEKQTNRIDVNCLVFSHNADGITVRDFTNTNHVLILWIYF